jgi:glutathione S-transferase
MRVHRIPFSTNVERVALALAFKGLEAEWVDHRAEDRSAIRALSGQDLVPVLETDDGAVIADSVAILAALEARVPSPALWPAAPAARAEADVFVDWFNRVWKVAPNAIDAELGAPQPDRARVDGWAAELRGSLERFEALLHGRDHLLGDAFGIADVVAFPFLKHATLHDPADDERFHAVLAEHLAPGDGFPRLRAWIERVDALPRAWPSRSF